MATSPGTRQRPESKFNLSKAHPVGTHVNRHIQTPAPVVSGKWIKFSRDSSDVDSTPDPIPPEETSQQEREQLHQLHMTFYGKQPTDRTDVTTEMIYCFTEMARINSPYRDDPQYDFDMAQRMLRRAPLQDIRAFIQEYRLLPDYHKATEDILMQTQQSQSYKLWCPAQVMQWKCPISSTYGHYCSADIGARITSDTGTFFKSEAYPQSWTFPGNDREWQSDEAMMQCQELHRFTGDPCSQLNLCKQRLFQPVCEHMIREHMRAERFGNDDNYENVMNCYAMTMESLQRPFQHERGCCLYLEEFENGRAELRRLMPVQGGDHPYEVPVKMLTHHALQARLRSITTRMHVSFRGTFIKDYAKHTEQLGLTPLNSRHLDFLLTYVEHQLYGHSGSIFEFPTTAINRKFMRNGKGTHPSTPLVQTPVLGPGQVFKTVNLSDHHFHFRLLFALSNDVRHFSAKSVTQVQRPDKPPALEAGAAKPKYASPQPKEGDVISWNTQFFQITRELQNLPLRTRDIHLKLLPSDEAATWTYGSPEYPDLRGCADIPTITQIGKKSHAEHQLVLLTDVVDTMLQRSLQDPNKYQLNTVNQFHGELHTLGQGISDILHSEALQKEPVQWPDEFSFWEIALDVMDLLRQCYLIYGGTWAIGTVPGWIVDGMSNLLLMEGIHRSQQADSDTKLNQDALDIRAAVINDKLPCTPEPQSAPHSPDPIERFTVGFRTREDVERETFDSNIVYKDEVILMEECGQEGPPGFKLALAYWVIHDKRAKLSGQNPRSLTIRTTRMMLSAGNYAVLSIAMWRTHIKEPDSWIGWLEAFLRDIVQDIITLRMRKELTKNEMNSMIEAIQEGQIVLSWPSNSWSCKIEDFAITVPLKMEHSRAAVADLTNNPHYDGDVREEFLRHKLGPNGQWRTFWNDKIVIRYPSTNRILHQKRVVRLENRMGMRDILEYKAFWELLIANRTGVKHNRLDEMVNITVEAVTQPRITTQKPDCWNLSWTQTRYPYAYSKTIDVWQYDLMSIVTDRRAQRTQSRTSYYILEDVSEQLQKGIQPILSDISRHIDLNFDRTVTENQDKRLGRQVFILRDGATRRGDGSLAWDQTHPILRIQATLTSNRLLEPTVSKYQSMEKRWDLGRHPVDPAAINVEPRTSMGYSRQARQDPSTDAEHRVDADMSLRRELRLDFPEHTRADQAALFCSGTLATQFIATRGATVTREAVTLLKDKLVKEKELERLQRRLADAEYQRVIHKAKLAKIQTTVQRPSSASTAAIATTWLNPSVISAASDHVPTPTSAGSGSNEDIMMQAGLAMSDADYHTAVIAMDAERRKRQRLTQTQ